MSLTDKLSHSTKTYVTKEVIMRSEWDKVSDGLNTRLAAKQVLEIFYFLVIIAIICCK